MSDSTVKVSIDQALQMAVQKHQSGQLEVAKQMYQQVLKVQPTNADALHLLGVLLAQQDNNEAAVQILEQVVQANPNSALFNANLANVYKALNRVDEAIEHYRRAIALNPNYPDPYGNLGMVLREREELDEAEACYRKALSLNTNDAMTFNRLGGLLLQRGRVEEAREAYRSAVTIDPKFAVAWRHLAQTTKFSANDDDIRRMESALASGGLDDDDVKDLRYALGKAHQDAGDYDVAFGHFEAGNRIMRSKLSFDIDQLVEHMQSIMDVFDADLMERSGLREDTADATPIFIIGMPRSGTTMVEQILTAHSQVGGMGEVKFLSTVANERLPEVVADGSRYPEAIRQVTEDQLRALANEYIEAGIAAVPDAKFITDKMPFNYVRLGVARMLFPNAKFVHCQRDAMDTCVSCLLTCFTEGNRFSYDQRELGLWYRMYEALMKHWHQTLPGQIFDVQYERLITDQEDVTRALLDHCGLGWDDACLSFHENKRPVRTASNAQVRQPIYGSSVGRWRNYEKHLETLAGLLEVGVG